MITVQLNDVALERFDSDIERLSKKAVKLHLQPITRRVTRTEHKPILDEFGGPTGMFYDMHTVEVDGAEVKIAGWQFAATLDNEGGSGTMIRKAPGFDLPVPTHYYSADTSCDHCHMLRYRKDVYLLYHTETEVWKQVGSSCLRDFLGHGNAESIATYWERVQQCIGNYTGDSDEDDTGGRAGGGTVYYVLREFMTHVAACIRERGYTSSKQAQEAFDGRISTAIQALDNMSAFVKKDNKVNVSDADVAKAIQVIAWAQTYFRAIGLHKRSEYEQNMAVTFTPTDSSEPLITRRMTGFAASAFGSYAREMERELRQKKAAEASTSEFVGKPKERLRNIKMTVMFVREFDGNYGVTRFYKLHDEHGNEYTWWASNTVLEQGAEILLTGTVKEHEEYHGVKQTVLTRCQAQQI